MTFWGVNVGLVGFLVGLITEIALLKQIFTPIMGVSILVAIGYFVVELSSGNVREVADPQRR